MSDSREYVTQMQGQSSVHISVDTICNVAAMAAVEVEGVSGLSRQGRDASDLAPKRDLSRAVKVHSETDSLMIDISLLVVYGFNIRTVASEVQSAVKASVEAVTGMQVVTVNVQVSGIAFQN